jgi:hypothetical protein
MSQNSVAPATGGTSLAESSDALAGTCLKDESACQSWLPRL